jgi:response regulator RpfG family c-di-GMP phosphodiesterase
MDEPGKELHGGVLFVDDEENILRSLRRLFFGEAFSVFTAPSPEQGIKIIENEPTIGVIVSDQRMPEVTGVQFLEQVRKVRPNSIRILLTGYSDINAVADAINKGGAFRYLTKPWNDEDLIQCIRESVKIYSLTLENLRLSEIVRQQNERLKDWNDELQQMVQEQTMELAKQNTELKKGSERQKTNFRSIIASMSSLIEMRDKTVRSHSKNVAEVSLLLAKKLELGAEEVESIMIAAILHDIGMIGIPDAMLVKDPQDMSPDEMEKYKLHPIRGQTAIDHILDLRPSAHLIRHHHERFDGQGFPDGISGKSIPLGARIIAMADFIDNFAAKHMGDQLVDELMARVDEEQGKSLDPHLTKFLRNIVTEVYMSGGIVDEGMSERELRIDQLSAGMIVSRDVRSGTGLLILKRGTALDQKHIKTLQRLFELDPSRSGVFVWSGRGEAPTVFEAQG